MSTSTERVVPLKNLQQQTYELLLNRIVQLEPGYEPGSRLNIPALAAELGVSLTPIKESLRLLQAHGLIEMSPRKGTYVATLTRVDFDEHLELLRELEVAALRLASGRITPARIEALRRIADSACERLESGQVVEMVRSNQQFHETLVALSGNRQLVQLYSSPRAYLLSTLYRSRDPQVEMRLIGQHVDIAAALERKQVELAFERIAAHWEDTRRFGHIAFEEYQRQLSSR